MWQLVRLNFGRNNAHFGELGIGMEETSERVYSDTLFSAWVSSYARLFGAEDVEQLLAKFPSGENQQNPPFRVSSTFIYSKKGESEYIYYLPKPLAYPQGYPVGEDLKFTKTYKKLKYLPLEIWQRWYQGEGFTDEDKQELIAYTNKDKKDKDKKDLEDSGTFSYVDTYRFYTVPKVAIDRNTHAANIYHTGFVQYQWESEKKSGLYFLIQLSDEDKETESKLKASLRLLGEEQILTH
jgi:CRISPR-associated protein Csm4